LFKLRFGTFLIICTVAIVGLYFLEKEKGLAMLSGGKQTDLNNNYQSEVQQYRQKVEERLRSPDSWLSVVGLNWLKDGKNTIGSATTNQIQLPASAPAKLGEITLKGDRATIEIFELSGVTIDDNPARIKLKYELKDDTAEKPTTIRVGTVSFFVLKRKNGLGVRIKDSDSEARKNFVGREWYPIKKEYQIDAEWVAHDSPKKLIVPDIIGNMNEELSPGFATFTIDGVNVKLHPTQEGDSLFFVFRDSTSGKETYGAARFLYTELPQNGRVILDFNKAVNPPCAFTKYATCPMPPKENILDVPIRAGELVPTTSAH
jgi:uncharacterized protein